MQLSHLKPLLFLVIVSALMIASIALGLGWSGSARDWVIFLGIFSALVFIHKLLLKSQITDSKSSALEFSDERYKHFLALSSEGIWRAELKEKIPVDLDTDEQVKRFFDHAVLAECNDTMAKMYGYEKADDIIGKHVKDLLIPSDPANWEYLRAFVRSGYNLREAESHEVDKNNNPKFFLNSFVGVVRDGYLLRAWGTQQDITQRKGTERELIVSSQRLQAIIESSEDAIVTKTLQGIITSWNAAAERIFEYRAEEMIGESIMKIIPPDRRHEEETILAKLSRGERIEHFETERRTKSGQRIYISVSTSPIRDSSGTIIGAAKIAHDTTARKKYEMTLREEEAKYRALAEERTRLLEQERAARSEMEKANRIKDEFLLTLSHELRTPLNAILGWSQLMARKELSPERLREGLIVIERNARGQAQIIDDLLDMNRIMSGKIRLELGKMELTSLVNGAIDSIMPSARSSGIALEYLNSDLPITVNVDSARITQVFWNLLTNAVKFTPRGGKVTVTIHLSPSEVEVAVRDTGEGINPEFLPFVFDRFRQADSSTTRRQRGLGLGLSIVRQLVELHGGRVKAESAGQGKGSTFLVTLPLASTAEETAPLSDGQEPPITRAVADEAVLLKGKSILVVDDEQDAKDLLHIVLQEQGAEVFTANSAHEALKIIESRPIDIILSDIGMPGQDGYELIRKVRSLPAEKGGRIPAIAVTAFARREDRLLSISAGFQMHVSKPVEPSELIAAVSSITSGIKETPINSV